MEPNKQGKTQTSGFLWLTIVVELDIGEKYARELMKVDEIRARVAFQRDIRDCNILCLTETWLTRETLSESVQPAGFSRIASTETNIFLVRRGAGRMLHG